MVSSTEFANNVNFACNSGGKFFDCPKASSGFVGCCDTGGDACKDGCETKDLKPTTFNKTLYTDITPQKCVTPNALFYTCTGTSPPFFGCCTSNPCAANPSAAQPCPQARLGITVIDFDAAGNSLVSLQAAEVGKDKNEEHHTSGGKLGAIIGGSVGGFAIIFLGLLAFFFLRKRNRRARALSDIQPYDPGMNEPADEDKRNTIVSQDGHTLSAHYAHPDRRSGVSTLVPNSPHGDANKGFTPYASPEMNGGAFQHSQLGYGYHSPSDQTHYQHSPHHSRHISGEGYPVYEAPSPPPPQPQELMGTSYDTPHPTPAQVGHGRQPEVFELGESGSKDNVGTHS